MQDSRIYDENGNEIYGGRGARSKHCREMISDGLAYRMNGEETLVCMQVETPAEATVSESAGSLREVAEEMADELGVHVQGYEVRMQVGDKTFIAELGEWVPASLSRAAISCQTSCWSDFGPAPRLSDSVTERCFAVRSFLAIMMPESENLREEECQRPCSVQVTGRVTLE